MTKNQPATPLPFSLDAVRPEATKMYATIRASDRTIPIRVSGPNASQDATFLVIAANAYPKLVDALRRALDDIQTGLDAAAEQVTRHPDGTATGATFDAGDSGALVTEINELLRGLGELR